MIKLGKIIGIADTTIVAVSLKELLPLDVHRSLFYMDAKINEKGRRDRRVVMTPATFHLFLHHTKWVRGGELTGARRRVSQNSQQGETLCSEFGKHR